MSNDDSDFDKGWDLERILTDQGESGKSCNCLLNQFHSYLN